MFMSGVSLANVPHHVKGEKHVEYTEGIFVGYRGYEKSGTQPLFPFGFGLSYTTFAYSDLKIASATTGTGALVEITFREKTRACAKAPRLPRSMSVILTLLCRGLPRN